MSDRTVLVVNGRRGVADLHAAWLNAVSTTRTAYSVDQALEALDDTVDAILVDDRLTRKGAVLEAIEERKLDCRTVLLCGEGDAPGTDDHEFDERLTEPVSQTDLREKLRTDHEPAPAGGSETDEAVQRSDSTGPASGYQASETGDGGER
jgi:DNA-binding NtrC family response regulator